jgi:protein TonB
MISLRPSVLSARTPSALRSRQSRWIGLAVLLSVALHAGAIIVLLTAAHRGTGAPPPVQGAVELLMVERKGAEASQAAPPPTPPQPEVKPKVEQKPEKASPPPPPSTPAPVAQTGELPAPSAEPPPPEPAKPQPPQPQPPAPQPTQTAETAQPAPPVKPAPPSPQKAPVFDFSGTDSPSDAEVIGGDVLPASPDDRFRNRPPVYPLEAGRRGEHGSVTLVIHVNADGSAAGAEVAESSGYPTLDDAALVAVRTWHFRPAMRDGQTVPFDMPFRFDFRVDGGSGVRP